jgi:DNA-directed RNA polymerase specialized sigma24 family protein
LGRGRRQEEVLDDVPEQDEMPAHHALLEWSAWVRGSRGGSYKLASLEGRYVAEIKNVFAEKRTLRPATDARLAEKVNAALLWLPDDYRMALRLRYHQKASPRSISRAVCIAPRQYPAYMRAARLLLQEKL